MIDLIWRKYRFKGFKRKNQHSVLFAAKVLFVNGKFVLTTDFLLRKRIVFGSIGQAMNGDGA